MTNVIEFVDNFLEHEYDPVKARQYYLRTRKLKGRAGVAKDANAKAYETGVVDAAQKQLSSDLKKNPKVKTNTKRRIDAAEQKLIRAKSLAQRVKDPVVRADMFAQIAATEKKLKSVKTKTLGLTTKSVLKKKPNPAEGRVVNGKRVHTVPDLAGRPPGHPNYGDDPPAKQTKSSSSVGASTSNRKAINVRRR